MIIWILYFIKACMIYDYYRFIIITSLMYFLWYIVIIIKYKMFLFVDWSVHIFQLFFFQYY